MIPQNDQVEEDLQTLPNQVADALYSWRLATAEKEKLDALLYLQFKGEGDKTVDEIKSLVKSNPTRFEAILNEIKAESDYVRLYERLLSLKRVAGLRTAF